MAENSEALVLTDGAGTYYVVPKAALAGFQVAEADVATLEDAIGVEDVEGFGSISTTRSNIKSVGSITSLGFFSAVSVSTGSVSTGAPTSGIAIKEQGVK